MLMSMQTTQTRNMDQDEFFRDLSDRVLDLENKEKLLEARQAADGGVSAARKAYDSPSFGEDELVMALEIRGSLAKRQGRVADARADYEEAFRVAQKQPENLSEMGRMKTLLANMSESEGNIKEAIALYEEAITHYRQDETNENAQEIVANLQNNLAFLYEEIDNSDQAETLFLEALKYFYETYGINHDNTASVCSNVGNFYYKLGHYGRAREMQLMALSARQELYEKDHPNTAQSHANLALVLMSENEPDEAKKHFEEALQGFDKHLPANLSDYEAVAENYHYFLLNGDHPKEAEILKKRTDKRLARF